MTLRLARIDAASSTVTLSIEAPTSGVVLVDVALVERASPAPLHWRAGTWTKPPLDISLDTYGGLVALQFVLQDEHVRPEESSTLPAPEWGVPIFEVSEWPSNRYLNETIPVTASRLPDGELRLRVGEPQPLKRSCSPGGGLVMAFDESGEVAEVIIGPIGNEDWDDINAFSFGA